MAGDRGSRREDSQEAIAVILPARVVVAEVSSGSQILPLDLYLKPHSHTAAYALTSNTLPFPFHLGEAFSRLLLLSCQLQFWQEFHKKFLDRPEPSFKNQLCSSLASALRISIERSTSQMLDQRAVCPKLTCPPNL